MKHGNLFAEKLSIYKVIKMDNTILNDYSMEVLTQPNNQTKFVPEIYLIANQEKTTLRCLRSLLETCRFLTLKSEFKKF